jgi:hypothetical protein
MAAWDLREEDLIRQQKEFTGIEAFHALLRSYRDRNKPAACNIVFKAERIGALMPEINAAAREHLPVPVKFISLVRDPRAVYASQKNTGVPGTPLPMSINPVRTALRWKAAQKQIRAVTAGLKGSGLRKSPAAGLASDEASLSTNPVRGPEPIFHKLVRYEDMVSEPGEAKKALGEFLELDLSVTSPLKGDLMQRLDTESRSIHPLADREPRADRIDAWRTLLKPEEVYLVERTCRGFMYRAGYQEISEWPGLYVEITRFFQVLGLSLRKIYLILKYHLPGQAQKREG